MRFTSEVQDHIQGKKFSPNLEFEVCRKESSILERMPYLVDMVAGKSVVHLGFTDHLPLIEEKVKQGKWLHRLLEDSSSACLGVDIDGEAVEFVKGKFGTRNVYCHDITSSQKLGAITERVWDYFILGEILEHIDNPVSFLNAILLNYGDHFREIVITVPNAFDLANLRKLLKRREFINSDHRYWFTPFTLAKVVSRAGYATGEYEFCRLHASDSWVTNRLHKSFPILREGLIMHAAPLPKQ